MTSPTATIAHVLKGIDFPCSRENLLEHARRANALDDEIDLLSNMPDRDYRSMSEVFHGLREARILGEEESIDGSETDVEPPPEPRDFYDEITNPPPLTMPVPGDRQEMVAPWMWPISLTQAWLQMTWEMQKRWLDSLNKR